MDTSSSRGLPVRERPVPADRPAPSFDLDDLAAATALVRRYLPPTPQYRWPLLEEAVGGRLWVKHENHTPVGAFKIRGGLVYVDRLLRRTSVTGIISATRGNHGQSLAFAGRVMGVAVTIVVPHGNNADKNAAMRALGARVVEVGRDFEDARRHAAERAVADGLELVPSYHPDLVLGVATYAAELFAAVDDLDEIFVPVGMGSGAAALITTRDLLGLTTRIVGVVAEGAPAYARSWTAGQVVQTERADTFVDGVACRSPDPDALAVLAAGAYDVMAVSDDETAAAMRLLQTATHNLVEPAGAIALAGLIRRWGLNRGDADSRGGAGSRGGAVGTGAEAPAPRGPTAVILTGGNVDAATLRTVLAGETPTC